MSLSVFPPDSIQLPIHADDTPQQAPVYLLPLPSFPDILLFLCALHIFPMSSMKDAITGNTYYCPYHPAPAYSPPFLSPYHGYFYAFPRLSLRRIQNSLSAYLLLLQNQLPHASIPYILNVRPDSFH